MAVAVAVCLPQHGAEVLSCCGFCVSLVQWLRQLCSGIQDTDFQGSSQCVERIL